MQSYIRVDAELMDCDHENDHNQNKDAIRKDENINTKII